MRDKSVVGSLGGIFYGLCNSSAQLQMLTMARTAQILGLRLFLDMSLVSPLNDFFGRANLRINRQEIND